MTLAKGLGWMMAVVATSTLAGCAIHLPAQNSRIAYDDSDRDFYDRPYAPSPSYEPEGTVAPLRQRSEDVQRSLAAGDAAKRMLLPNAATGSVMRSGPDGLRVEPAFDVEALLAR